MNHFTTVHDVKDLNSLVEEALILKKDPYRFASMGRNKTLGLIFLNPSLRTRMSTQKAASSLGMQVMSMNIDKEGWALELEDGAVMNGSTVEHVKEAAAVMGRYCDIIGIRCFPGLKNKADDYSEKVLLQFMRHTGAPVLSMESATLHPLQSLADLITIREQWKSPVRPGVVLTWAPHIKPLPQAVANSFSEWMCKADVDFTVVQPKGYELCEDYTRKAKIVHNQEEALKGADFVYVKNWSSYADYGKMPEVNGDWMLTQEKLKNTNKARVMHCLPVRRNIELSDEILDSSASLVLEQAENRLYSAQVVLKKMLEQLHARSTQKVMQNEAEAK